MIPVLATLFVAYLLVAGFVLREMVAWREDVRLWSLNPRDHVPLVAVILVPIGWPAVLVAFLVWRLVGRFAR